MKKISSSIIFLLIISFLLSGCNVTPSSGSDDVFGSANVTAAITAKPTPEVETEASYAEDWNLDKALETSPYIFECVCGNKQPEGQSNTADMDMLVINSIRGDLANGETIPYRSVFGSNYSDGRTYLVFAYPLASVYEGRELFYHEGAVVYDEGGKLFTNGMRELDGLSYAEAAELVETSANDHPYAGDKSVRGAYCTSESLDEIAAFSDCVVKIRAAETVSDSVSDRTTYLCTVLECFKGEAEGSITVVSFKHSLEAGEEYLLLLMKQDDGSLYTLSSVKSVLPAGSPEAKLVTDLFGDQ